MGIIKLIILGYGSIGKRHIKVIKNKYPEIEITCVTRQRPKDITCKWIARSEFSTIDRYFDIGIIATPINCHLSDIDTLLSCCSTILVEKPVISLTSLDKDHKRIEELSTHRIYVGYNMKFYPILMSIKENMNKIIKSNQIYSYYSYCKSHIRTWRGSVEASRVSLDNAQDGGVLNELSHEIDIFLWVHSYNTPKSSWVKDNFPSLLDQVVGIKKLANDHVMCGFDMDNATAIIDLTFTNHQNTRKIEISTKEKTFVYDLITGTEEHYELGEITFKYKHKHNRDETFKDQLCAIINESESENLTKLSQAIKMHRLFRVESK